MQTTNRVSIFSFVVALHSLLLLAGCEGHAREVFNQQHQLSVALMHATTAAEMEGSDRVGLLYDAEKRLKEACAAMKRAAYLKMNQQEVDGATGLAVMGTLDDCERTAKETEELLWQVNPDIARDFLGERTVSASNY